MYIFIKAHERNDRVKIECSPTDNIEKIRDLIAQEFGRKYPPDKQRLFFGGKQVI